MIAALGALSHSLMHRCGIKTDRARPDTAYEFRKKVTVPNGYVWHSDTPGCDANITPQDRNL